MSEATAWQRPPRPGAPAPLLGQLVEDLLLDGGRDLRVVASVHEVGDGVRRLLRRDLRLAGLDVAVGIRVRVTGQESARGGLLSELLLLPPG